jgi:Mg-chelatase subunit ChlD
MQKTFRWWAFWRRLQYGTAYFMVVSLVLVGVYYNYFYQAPNCFDGTQNSDELGVDCGGPCVRICSFSVIPPREVWAKSFAVTSSQYNAVAYIENRNQTAGTPELRYRFELYDATGLITVRDGVTTLPPNSTYPIFEGRINTDGRTPTRTVLVLNPPELWLPANYDRNNYRTISLELLDIDARPRLNVLLQNDDLVESRNVEVVATIFDSQGNPLTASQTFIDIFPGRSASELVFTWPQPIAKTIRSCDVPSDIMIVLDRSGSMAADGGTPPEPLESAKLSAATFVNQLRATDQVGFVSYATTPSVPLEQTLTSNRAAARQAILGTAMGTDGTQYTDMGAALQVATNELLSTRHRTDARKVMIFFTDKDVTRPLNPAGQRDVEFAANYARQMAVAAKEKDITIYTIGFGDFFQPASNEIQRDTQLIADLASAPEFSYTAPTIAELERVYREIAESICEDGPTKIDVLPKTSNIFAPWP